MANPRVHFIDLPPPEAIWLIAGERAAPQALPGAKVSAGAVVAGVEHTSTVAVTPLAGEVGKVQEVIDWHGRPRPAVGLLVADEAEHQPAPTEAPAELATVRREDLPTWIDRLERAGVRAQRHNSPDLLAQLLACVGRRVDTVLCHTLEADPSLPLQIQWALRHPHELRDGLRLLARLTGARRTVVGVGEQDHRRLHRRLKRRHLHVEPLEPLPAVALLRPEPQSVIVPFEPEGQPDPAPAAPEPAPKAAARTAEPLGMRLVPIRNTYPQADPTLLAFSLASRRLLPGQLPTDAGLLILDAIAAVAVGMVARGAGVIRREPLGVRDHRTDVSILADAWRGTRISDVLRPLGLLDQDGRVQVRTGDFLRSRVLPPEAILDGGEATLHLHDPGSLPVSPEPCIRCGWCLDICPTHVHPAGLLEAAQRKDAALAGRFGVAACIECGLCSYICPSRLPLLEAARVMRGKA